MTPSLVPLRLSVSPLAELMIQWLKERLGDLVLINVCSDVNAGELTWSPANMFLERQDLLLWDELMGCPFYVQVRDFDHLAQAGLKVELAFERNGELSSFTSFRLVTAVRPFTEDEAVLFEFAQERKAADTAAVLIQQFQKR